MTVVRKRKQSSSIEELTRALKQFSHLLEAQDELDAACDLQKALRLLQSKESENHLKAITMIENAFEDEHELDAYTVPSRNKEGVWDEREALYLASTSVISLSRRIKKTLG